jgi:polar amino acid transport system ATP-binding protein
METRVALLLALVLGPMLLATPGLAADLPAIIFLDQGKIVEVGTPEEVFGRARQETTRRFLERILA